MLLTSQSESDCDVSTRVGQLELLLVFLTIFFAIHFRIITVCIVHADTVFRDSIRIGGNGFGFIVDKNLRVTPEKKPS
jgi:hypothetical protein